MDKKKVSDLEVIQASKYDCFDIALISAFNFMGVDYQYMFMAEWNFKYYPYNLNIAGTENKHLDITSEHRWDLLEICHGVKLTNVAIDTDIDYLEKNIRCEEELKNGHPVLATVDLYWCPWFIEEYQRYSRLHAVVIVDLDDDFVYLKDSQMAQDGVKIPHEEFRKCVLSYGFLEFNLPKRKIDWKKEICNMVNRLVDNDVFENINKFADDIKIEEFISTEIEQFDGAIYTAPMLESIACLSRKRKQFGDTLEYISKEYDDKQLESISIRMIKIGDLWSSVFGMICKAYCITNDKREQIMGRVSDKIRDISRKEEEIALDLKSILYGGEISLDESKHDYELKKQISESSFLTIDIENKLNTNGLSNIISYDSKAEFTSEKRYLYVKNLPKLVIDGIPFKMNEIDDEKNDNISCFGESIEVGLDYYSGIYFLCCADLESHREDIKIEYEDGLTKIHELNVSSWINPPSFHEKIAFHCYGVVRQDETHTASTYPFKGNIFIQYIKLDENKKMNRINLPICPNIHIFALTMESLVTR